MPLWKDGVDQSPEVVGIFHVGLKKKIAILCNPGMCKELTMRKKKGLKRNCVKYLTFHKAASLNY